MAIIHRVEAVMAVRVIVVFLEFLSIGIESVLKHGLIELMDIDFVAGSEQIREHEPDKKADGSSHENIGENIREYTPLWGVVSFVHWSAPFDSVTIRSAKRL